MIQALDEEQKYAFSVRSFYGVLESIDGFEIFCVTDLCGKMSNTSVGIEMPESVKLAGLSVCTDEMYHALIAGEFLSDLKQFTKIEPFSPIPPAPVEMDAQPEQSFAQLKLVDFLTTPPSPETSLLVDIVLLCFLENSLTDDLIKMTKETSSENPLYTCLREHLQDEALHNRYFQLLLAYIWKAIDEPLRIDLGRAIIKYLEYYFCNPTMIMSGYEGALMRAGLSPKDAQMVIARTFEHSPEQLRVNDKGLKPKTKLMIGAGIFDHAPTYELFISHPLLQGLLGEAQRRHYAAVPA